MLISHPVSREVSRAFCPFFPMASESWSSSTEICTFFFSVSKTRFFIFAGLSASRTYSFGSELQRMISTFSLLSSRTMFFTREPRMPTHAPTGSTFSFARHTSNLDRPVGNLAYFQLKQASHEIRMAAGHNYLRAACTVFHRHHVGA